MKPILSITGLTKRFGGLTAVDHLSVDFAPGKLHAVIGPNGAGKTTFFNLVSGFLRSDSGTVCFAGEDITNLKPHEISRRGIARTLQVKSVFGQLTVAENVWIAAQAQSGSLSWWRPASSYRSTAQKVERLMEQYGLAALAKRQAGTLSYGDMALLEIAIALAGDPKLLLLDEPICGMSPKETADTVSRIRVIAEDVAVILIEHDMEVVFEIADEIAVLAQGSLLARGTAAEIAADERVREAYLGAPEDEEADDAHA